MWLMSSHTKWKTENWDLSKTVACNCSHWSRNLLPPCFKVLKPVNISLKHPTRWQARSMVMIHKAEMTLGISILDMTEGNIQNLKQNKDGAKSFLWSWGYCALLMCSIQSNCEVTFLFRGAETSWYHLSQMVGNKFTVTLHLFAQITLCDRF